MSKCAEHGEGSMEVGDNPIPGVVCLSLIVWIGAAVVTSPHSHALADTAPALCLRPEAALSLRGGGGSEICSILEAATLR